MAQVHLSSADLTSLEGVHDFDSGGYAFGATMSEGDRLSFCARRLRGKWADQSRLRYR